MQLTRFALPLLAACMLALPCAAGAHSPPPPASIPPPVPPASVLAHAAALGADLWRAGVDFAVEGDKQQWGWSGRGRRNSGLAYPALRGANQLVNAAGVLAALSALREVLPVTAQAVRSGLATVELPGRFQIVPGQPALVLDVAHNGHAAAALAANLDAMGYFPATHAVFGAMADKELASIWARMHPLVDHWYFTDLPTPRAARGTALQAQWQAHQKSAAPTGPARAVTRTSQAYADPASALSAALAAADPADRIVVFGSFYTVGGVLQQGLPQRAAPHLAP